MKNTIIVVLTIFGLAIFSDCTGTGAGNSPKDVGKNNMETDTGELGTSEGFDAETEGQIMKDYYEEETSDMVEFPIPIFDTRVISTISYYPIKLKHPDEDAIFQCSVETGTLSIGGIYSLSSKNVAVKPTDALFSMVWFSDANNVALNGSSEYVIIEIILKIDKNIIGYAVVEVSRDSFIYTGRLLKSVFIPVVDGKYQNVTEEQVKTAIDKIKGENKWDNSK